VSEPVGHAEAPLRLREDRDRGRRLELPWFAGKVIERGRRHGIPTPVNGFIYAALKPYVSGPPT
jgi:2-dehydropantoate 2-reductase